MLNPSGNRGDPGFSSYGAVHVLRSHRYTCIVAVQWLCAAKSAPETFDFYTSATLVLMLSTFCRIVGS